MWNTYINKTEKSSSSRGCAKYDKVALNFYFVCVQKKEKNILAYKVESPYQIWNSSRFNLTLFQTTVA